METLVDPSQGFTVSYRDPEAPPASVPPISPGQQARALGAMAAILRPGGILLLGWNRDRIADPIAAGLVSPSFTAAPLAGQAPRVRFGSVTHIYDSLVRRPTPWRRHGVVGL